MAKQAELTKLEDELEHLQMDGRNLQRTLATVASDYGVYLKKYNETSERILAKSFDTQRVSPVTVSDTASNSALVLVLVDGTTHEFHDGLYRNKQCGGAETAKRLRSVINERVAAIIPDVARRLWGFTLLNSTKIGPFFDFIDTGGVGQVPLKVCENFKLYMANDQCKHVFFAATGARRYHQALEPYRGQTKKVTIVLGSIMDNEIRKLGLHAVSFNRVFKPGTVINSNAIITPAAVESDNKTPTMTSSGQEDMDRARNVTDISQGQKQWDRLLSKLPKHPVLSRIPINGSKQRLDIRMQPPTPAELQSYEDCTNVQNMCPDFHLRGQCNAINCKLAHGTLDPEALYALQHKMLGISCLKGSACRRPSCFYGHVCQRRECTGAGGRTRECGLSDAMHKVDFQVVEWVTPDDGIGHESGVVKRISMPVPGAPAADGVYHSIQDDLLIWT